jgi:hypothetical protein
LSASGGLKEKAPKNEGNDLSIFLILNAGYWQVVQGSRLFNLRFRISDLKTCPMRHVLYQCNPQSKI